MAIRGIALGQAVDAVDNPVRVVEQADGRTRYWGFSIELQHFIRVVVDRDGITIVTAFIDSNFRP
jgi:hypothetical protein